MKRLHYRWLVPSLFFLVAACVLLPVLLNPLGFAFWRNAPYSDLLISHWPNTFYLRRSLQTWQQIPLWNSQILSGAPFAADPLSGLWYAPYWLSVLIPISLAFNLLFWIHLAWAGIGMWLLMREEGVGLGGAFAAGVAFLGTSKFIAHLGLGHLGMVCAVSWWPWMLWLTGRAVKRVVAVDRSWLRWSALAGTCLGIIFLADPRMSVPIAILAAGYGLYTGATHRSEENEGTKNERWGRLALAGALVVFLAVMIASALAFPLWEFLQLSTRESLAMGEQATLSMPPSRLLDVLLIFPDQPEWIAYLGVGVILLAVMGIVGRTRGAAFWGVVVLSGWVLALGDHTFFYTLFTRVTPAADFLRVPPRMLFYASLGAAVLAGKGMDWLIHGEHTSDTLRSVRLAAVGCGTLMLAVAISLGIMADLEMHFILVTGAFACLGTVWVFLSIREALPRTAITLGWVVLIAAELILVDSRLIEIRSRADALGDRLEIAEALRDQGGTWRTLSPSYSLPQQAAAQAGLEMADGVNPMQLRVYRDTMAQALHFSTDDYFVTLPPYLVGDPQEPWDIDLDIEQLDVLNIRTVLSDYALEAEGLQFEEQIGEVYIYRNPGARPRAWVEKTPGDSDSEWTPVESTHWTPNQISVQASGPGTLVLSEIAYPGWQVTVDGVRGQVETVDGLLRGVPLSAGRHEVTFTFRPTMVYVGIVISLLGTLLLAILWIRK